MKKINSKISILSILLLIVILILAIIPLQQASALTTSARGAVLMEKNSRRVLYSVNMHERMPMASTTKIFTALAIINNCRLDDIVEIDKRAVGVEGSSIYLRASEHLTVRELLYGLMLQSGNDCAVALAIHCSGGVENFAKLVNAMCHQYNLTDTNIVNPHGLHDDDHYTTAYDLAVISSIALCNEEFCKIVSTKSIKISNEGMDYDRVIINKNKLLHRYEYGDGVKTGYTKRAGRCFVGSASRDNMQLVAVVLNCPPMFENAQSMLEYGFTNYTMTNIVPQNKPFLVKNEENVAKKYYCSQSIDYPIRSNEELKDIDVDIEIVDKCPTIKVLHCKQLIFLQKLVTI